MPSKEKVINFQMGTMLSKAIFSIVLFIWGTTTLVAADTVTIDFKTGQENAAVNTRLLRSTVRANRVINIPEGTYYLRSSVGIEPEMDNLTIAGAGESKTKLIPVDGVHWNLQSNGSNDYVDKFTLKDLTFDEGDNLNKTFIVRAALSRNLTVQNVAFNGMVKKGSHLFDLGGANTIKFDNISVNGAISAGDAQNHKEAIQIDYSSSDFVSGGDSERTLSLMSSDGKPFKMDATRKVWLLNSHFNGYKNTPYSPQPIGSHTIDPRQGTAEGTKLASIVVRNNEFINPMPQKDATGAYSATLHFVNTANIAITGNTFKFTTTPSARLLHVMANRSGKSINGGTLTYQNNTIIGKAWSVSEYRVSGNVNFVQ